MHFSYSNAVNGSKTSRFVLVAGLHVAIGALLVHSISTRKISLPSLPDAIQVVMEPVPQQPPPPPPEPPKPVQQIAPPDLFVPKPEVPVAAPPDPVPMQTTHEADPAPQPAMPATSAPEAPPSTPSNANTGQMRTAVFADANSCALPDYPTNAARNGETGTTMLALLVGTDGRVTSARVEHGSGSRELDRAALRALSLCRFKPATNNGTPEAGWAQLAYVWRLD